MLEGDRGRFHRGTFLPEPTEGWCALRAGDPAGGALRAGPRIEAADIEEAEKAVRDESDPGDPIQDRRIEYAIITIILWRADTGCWILDTGCLQQAPLSRIQHPASSIGLLQSGRPIRNMDDQILISNLELS